MGKKGGGSRMSSVSNIFAKRGDPLISEKERIRDFGRTPETENPERDWWYLYSGQGQHTRARIAEDRPVHHERRPERDISASPTRKAAMIKYEMRQAQRRAHLSPPRSSREERTLEEQRREELNARLLAIHKERESFRSTGTFFKGKRSKKK